MGPEPFRPIEILRVLIAHQVEFVVIGGFGAYLQGSPLPTLDVDITPRAGAANLARLADALIALDARIYAATEPDGLPFDRSAEMLARAQVWNLITVHGALDISTEPAGTAGYDDLRRAVVRIVVDGLDVPVAALADIVRSKEAAAREKDRRALPTLRKLLARQDEQER